MPYIPPEVVAVTREMFFDSRWGQRNALEQVKRHGMPKYKKFFQNKTP